MILEVIATSLTEALDAERGGADRIELVSAMSEGGLTPSLGVIETIVDAVRIPVNVIVRPHSRSYCYDEGDLAAMLADIRHVKRVGAAGIVIGPLDESGNIHTNQLIALLGEAVGLDVTFHRAFDDLTDQIGALQTLAGFPQIRRVLTSAGPLPAIQVCEKLQALVQTEQKTGIRILAGHGLKVEGLGDFLTATGVSEIHFGSGVRYCSSFANGIDVSAITAIKRIMASYG